MSLDKVIEQFKWERDVAISQLKELGLSLGQDIESTKKALEFAKRFGCLKEENEKIPVELPYNFGTFVKVKDDNGEVDYYGTISAYTVTYDGVLVWVSGYKEAVSGEFLLENIEPMTEKEVEELKKKYE